MKKIALFLVAFAILALPTFVSAQTCGVRGRANLGFSHGHGGLGVVRQPFLGAGYGVQQNLGAAQCQQSTLGVGYAMQQNLGVNQCQQGTLGVVQQPFLGANAGYGVQQQGFASYGVQQQFLGLGVGYGVNHLGNGFNRFGIRRVGVIRSRGLFGLRIR